MVVLRAKRRPRLEADRSLGDERLLRSVKACLEISAIRNVWAAASRAIVQ